MKQLLSTLLIMLLLPLLILNGIPALTFGFSGYFALLAIFFMMYVVGFISHVGADIYLERKKMREAQELFNSTEFKDIVDSLNKNSRDSSNE